MHLVYITYGPNERNHLQAYFSITSFLARNAPLSSINVITDQPLFYKKIEKHLNIISVSQQILTEWKGEHGFAWRIKIKGLEEICLRYPNAPVMYLDTDTFLYGDFTHALDIVRSGHAAMQEHEGKLAAIGTRTASRMKADLSNVSFNGLPPLDSFDMWNAGAVLTPNTKQTEDIRLALALCDTMLNKKVIPQFVEQFSLAVALQHYYGLKPLGPFIAHYWSNKNEWNEMIIQFFISCHLQCLSDVEIMEKIRTIDFSSIPERRIKKNTNIRLKKIIDKYFVDKEIRYLKK